MIQYERIPLAEARVLAAEAVELLKGTTERLDIAGSIRRNKATIGDVEIVLRPRIDNVPEIGTLFEGATKPVNLEFEKVEELLRQGIFEHRVDEKGHKCCGERFQRLLYKGFPLDIFCCLPPAEYGVILLIRTGSKEFNERFVLQWAAGGKILKAGMQIKDGALYELGRKIPTPEETDVFEAVGLSYIEPWERTS